MAGAFPSCDGRGEGEEGAGASARLPPTSIREWKIPPRAGLGVCGGCCATPGRGSPQPRHRDAPTQQCPMSPSPRGATPRSIPAHCSGPTAPPEPCVPPKTSPNVGQSICGAGVLPHTVPSLEGGRSPPTSPTPRCRTPDPRSLGAPTPSPGAAAAWEPGGRFEVTAAALITAGTARGGDSDDGSEDGICAPPAAPQRLGAGGGARLPVRGASKRRERERGGPRGAGIRQGAAGPRFWAAGPAALRPAPNPTSPPPGSRCPVPPWGAQPQLPGLREVAGGLLEPLAGDLLRLGEPEPAGLIASAPGAPGRL